MPIVHFMGFGRPAQRYSCSAAVLRSDQVGQEVTRRSEALTETLQMQATLRSGAAVTPGFSRSIPLWAGRPGTLHGGLWRATMGCWGAERARVLYGRNASSRSTGRR